MMVHCNTCSRQISSEAKVCPHCGQPDPYTAADARLEVAISKRVEKVMDRETWVLLSSDIAFTLFGFVLGGGFHVLGFVGAFLGFIAGTIVAQAINKVLEWFI